MHQNACICSQTQHWYFPMHICEACVTSAAPTTSPPIVPAMDFRLDSARASESLVQSFSKDVIRGGEIFVIYTFFTQKKIGS